MKTLYYGDMKTLYCGEYVKLRGFSSSFRIANNKKIGLLIKKRHFKKTYVVEPCSSWVFSTLKDYKYNAELNIWVHKSDPDLDIIETERK